MTRRRIDDFPAGHPAWSLLTGATPLQACSQDPRFSYSMYVPTRYWELRSPLPLHVAVHGTARGVEYTRDRFADLSEERGMAVLAPLFPAGIDDPDDVHNYKSLLYRGIRFDEILLAMINEAAERWSVETERFSLSGFSGGGQFAHRFLYLHPERLRAVSIGAPGRVTLPDDEPWPLGLGGARDLFGIAPDLSTVAAIPLQVIVGGADLAADVLATVAGSPLEARAGRTRVERAGRLAAELSGLGTDVETVLVPGVAHDAGGVAPFVIDFLRRVLDVSHPATAPDAASRGEHQ